MNGRVEEVTLGRWKGSYRNWWIGEGLVEGLVDKGKVSGRTGGQGNGGGASGRGVTGPEDWIKATPRTRTIPPPVLVTGN